MNIDTCFATSILWTKLNRQNIDLNSLVERAYEIKTLCGGNTTEWQCDTFNSLGSHNLLDDCKFKPLNDSVKNMVDEFAKYYKVNTRNLNCTGAWVNIAPPGEYQEYHNHPNSHFSAVVYLKTQKDCGDIVFRNPSANFDMFKLPIEEDAPCNFDLCWYAPEDLKLLVFRSSLIHMVRKNKSSSDRISVAYNFVV